VSYARTYTSFCILNYTSTSCIRRNTLHVAQRFELFLYTYRRQDGGRWTGQKLDEATGGVVPRSYITNLRAGALTEEEVERTRTRRIADPTVGQVVSLAAVFGVEPSYLVDRGEPPTLDTELLEDPRDDSRDNPRGSAPAGARKGYRPRDSAAMRGGTLGAATKRSGRGKNAASALKSRLCSREDPLKRCM
jgi:hypothetical protein